MRLQTAPMRQPSFCILLILARSLNDQDFRFRRSRVSPSAAPMGKFADSSGGASLVNGSLGTGGTARSIGTDGAKAVSPEPNGGGGASGGAVGLGGGTDSTGAEVSADGGSSGSSWGAAGASFTGVRIP